MKKSIVLSAIVSLLITTAYAQEEKRDRVHSVRKVVDQVGKIDAKEVSEVDKARKMFSEGTVSGQFRIMYSESPEPSGAYATAIGGIIKYELAEYHGFNAAAAVYTSNDITFASGDNAQRYTDLSSSQADHTDMSEAYLNYRYDKLNFRAGRQVLDTPLADSDDIRMIQNSFEAYVLTYNLANAEFMIGNIQRWHGTDADLDIDWDKTGENGTNFAGISYSDILEFNVWYYNITELTNAAYIDIGFEYELSDTMLLHMGVQYLYESEINQSGVAASIYGVLAEVVVHDIGFNLSCNKSDKKTDKESFSGFGGGTLYTSMDTTILDDITADRDALAIVAGVSYEINKFGFLYAYGDFSGSENSQGEDAHVVEQDLGLGYNFNDEFVVALLYSDMTDKKDSLNDWDRVQMMLNYNF